MKNGYVILMMRCGQADLRCHGVSWVERMIMFYGLNPQFLSKQGYMQVPFLQPVNQKWYQVNIKCLNLLVNQHCLKRP